MYNFSLPFMRWSFNWFGFRRVVRVYARTWASSQPDVFTPLATRASNPTLRRRWLNSYLLTPRLYFPEDYRVRIQSRGAQRICRKVMWQIISFVDITGGICSITMQHYYSSLLLKAHPTQHALIFQSYTQLLVCYFKKSFLSYIFGEYPAPIDCAAGKNHDCMNKAHVDKQTIRVAKDIYDWVYT